MIIPTVDIDWLSSLESIEIKRQSLIVYAKINTCILAALEKAIKDKKKPNDIKIPLKKIISEDCDFSEKNTGYFLTGLFDSFTKDFSKADWSFTVDSGETITLHCQGLGFVL
jgi:hypothetical protein